MTHSYPSVGLGISEVSQEDGRYFDGKCSSVNSTRADLTSSELMGPIHDDEITPLFVVVNCRQC